MRPKVSSFKRLIKLINSSYSDQEKRGAEREGENPSIDNIRNARGDIL